MIEWYQHIRMPSAFTASESSFMMSRRNGVAITS